MCEDEIPVSVDEEKGKNFEEEKRIKKANGYEYKPLAGAISVGIPSAPGDPDPICNIVGHFVKIKK